MAANNQTTWNEVLQNASVLAFGDRCWGKGQTLTEAKTKMREAGYIRGRSGPVKFYLVHPDTRVDATGCICSPAGCTPRLLHEEGNPKPRKT